MADMNKWEKGHKLLPEEEGDYLKDLCAYLREQQTLSDPKRAEEGHWVCDVVPDEIAAHAADIIEELFDRVQKLQYELKEAKNV